MTLEELRVDNYRSIRSLELPLGKLTVVVGPNGCGKTNLYRTLFLLAASAEGRLSRSLAEEGGLPSALWAGERRKGPVRTTTTVRFSGLEYSMSLGLVANDPTANPPTQFLLDPEVKEESIHWLEGGRRSRLMDRKNQTVSIRDADGTSRMFPAALSTGESVLSQLQEPHLFPTLSMLRQTFLGWRFYHQFRTDPSSPLREPQIGVQTPVLGHDGHDLAAALQTIVEFGDQHRLEEMVRQALEANLVIESKQGRFTLYLAGQDFQRPFAARELSDGTLRYMCLLAALLSPRPPLLLALNEPESSLHTNLHPPLADLIADAATRSQVWVTTHSERLAELIAERAEVTTIALEKVDGATQIVRSRARP